MKRICFILICTLSVLLVSCGSKKNANGWFSDFEAAKHVAKSKSKNIVLFVNSIYDTKGTEDGVSLLLDTPEFTKSVSEDFVCVHFDFSKIPEIMGQDPTSLTGSEQKSLEKKQNALLEQMKFADLYGIRETPVLLIISKDGFYIASVNFDYLESAVSSYKSAVYMEIGTVQDFEERLRTARKGDLVSRMNAYNQILEETEEYRRPIFYELLKEAAGVGKKGEGAGRKFSDYCREILLNGEVTAVPKMTDNEREAIAILQHTGRFYGQVSNLIKVKDEYWLHITKNLSLCAKEAFKRFYDPHFRVDDEVYKVLNLTRNDRKM